MHRLETVRNLVDQLKLSYAQDTYTYKYKRQRILTHFYSSKVVSLPLKV